MLLKTIFDGKSIAKNPIHPWKKDDYKDFEQIYTTVSATGKYPSCNWRNTYEVRRFNQRLP